MKKQRTIALPLRDMIIKSMIVTLLAAAALFITGHAFAQGASTTLSGFSERLAYNTAAVPKFIAILCYVIGTFFTASGLLKLKDWINDSERNTLMSALMRLIVATLLILLPHTIRITIGTFFNRADGRADNNVRVTAPALAPFK